MNATTAVAMAALGAGVLIDLPGLRYEVPRAGEPGPMEWDLRWYVPREQQRLLFDWRRDPGFTLPPEWRKDMEAWNLELLREQFERDDATEPEPLIQLLEPWTSSIPLIIEGTQDPSLPLFIDVEEDLRPDGDWPPPIIFAGDEELLQPSDFKYPQFLDSVVKKAASQQDTSLPEHQLLELLDHATLEVLESALLSLGDMAPKIDFSNPAVLQRSIEILTLHHTDNGRRDMHHHDLALTLATDLRYIISSPTHDLAEHRAQYLKLLNISRIEFEKTLGVYKFSPEGEAAAREIFDQMTLECLSYFETPRLAALARPRTQSEMANLTLTTANEMQDGTRKMLEQMFAPEQLSHRTPESAQRYRDMTLSTIAGSLACNPFMFYVVDGMHAPDHEEHINRIAQTDGINAGRRSFDGKSFVGVRYSFAETEKKRLFEPTTTTD